MLSIATRAELDTSQDGANSLFWVYVASKFNGLSPDEDPNMESIDFLDKVHFTHQYYDSHFVTINPGNHNLFSSTKLRTMWNKIKGDYDLAMTNFTKSGNHSSSFTATAMKNILFNYEGVKQKRMTTKVMKKMKTWMKIQKEYRRVHLLILPGHCQLFIYDNG